MAACRRAAGQAAGDEDLPAKHEGARGGERPGQPSDDLGPAAREVDPLNHVREARGGGAAEHPQLASGRDRCRVR